MHVPEWIDQEIMMYDVRAIQDGGCESGAYMPAVTYWEARRTMAEHGDDVLAFIEERIGEVPPWDPEASWSGLCCHFLSMAVELWADGLEADWDDDRLAREV